MQLGPITEITSEQPWRNAALNSRVSRDPDKGLGMMTVYLDEEDPEWDSGPVIPDSLINKHTGYPLYAPIMIDDRPVGGQLVLFYDWRPCDDGPGGMSRWRANEDLKLTVEGSGVLVFKGLDQDCDRKDTIMTPVERLPLCVNKGEYGVLEALEIYILESDSTNPINHIELFDKTRTYGWWPIDQECCDDELCCRTDHDSSFWMSNWIQAIVDPVDVIKFGHWGRTYCNPLVYWEDRIKPEYFSMGHKKGVAYEYWIELANFMQKDIWINVPHQADDAFIDSMAALFHSRLDTNLQVYLEYSTEVWSRDWDATTCLDSLRSQYHFAASQGEGSTPSERRIDWIVSRSQYVFQRFAHHFDSSRLTRVLALPSRNYPLADSILAGFADLPHDSLDFDAMAIAPVLGWDFEVNSNYCFANNARLQERLENDLDSVFRQMSHYQLIAESRGKEILAYAAPYDVPIMNCDDDTFQWTKWVNDHYTVVNGVYCEYMIEWYELTDGLLIFDMSMSRYDRREEDEGDLVFETHMKGFERCTSGGISGPHGDYFLNTDACPILPVLNVTLYEEDDQLYWIPWIEDQEGQGVFTLEFSRSGEDFIDLVDMEYSGESLYQIDKNDLVNWQNPYGLYRVRYTEGDRRIYSNTIRVEMDMNVVQISLQPNPVFDRFSIELMGDVALTSIALYNSLGTSVAFDFLHQESSRHYYSCANLVSGIYFVRISAMAEGQHFVYSLPLIKS